MPTRIGKQSVVVGAGMAGLIVARSLADFFEHVIVLENDELPKEATHRPGTPQSRQVHVLLTGGLIPTTNAHAVTTETATCAEVRENTAEVELLYR